MKHILKIVSQEIVTLNSLLEHVQNNGEASALTIDLALRKVNDIYNELLMLKSSGSNFVDLETPQNSTNRKAVTPPLVVETANVKEQEVNVKPEPNAIIKSNESTYNQVEIAKEPVVLSKDEIAEKEIVQVDVTEEPIAKPIILDEASKKVNDADAIIDSIPENKSRVEPGVENKKEFSLPIEKEIAIAEKIEPIAKEPSIEPEVIEEELKIEDEPLPVFASNVSDEPDDLHEVESNVITESIESEDVVDEVTEDTRKNKSVFADRFQDTPPSLNDLQASINKTKDLASQFADRPIFHLKSAIKINDRIWFVNELFNRDVDLYNETLSKIDAMQNLDEALALLFASFKWDQEKKSTISFLELVFRRFANQN